MLNSLPLTPRTTRLGCGIYEAGNTETCYVLLFVTDAGRVLPVNHRAITEDDLMEAYVWGRLEERDLHSDGTEPEPAPDEEEEG